MCADSSVHVLPLCSQHALRSLHTFMIPCSPFEKRWPGMETQKSHNGSQPGLPILLVSAHFRFFFSHINPQFKKWSAKKKKKKHFRGVFGSYLVKNPSAALAAALFPLKQEVIIYTLCCPDLIENISIWINLLCLSICTPLAGLSHDHNMRKMRLLTFMMMAETKKEMDFQLIQEELVLGPQAVEEFIIDGAPPSLGPLFPHFEFSYCMQNKKQRCLLAFKKKTKKHKRLKMNAFYWLDKAMCKFWHISCL